MLSKTVTVGPHPAAMVMQFITYVANLIELLLGIRFILRLLGANPANMFAAFVYNVSDVFLTPFRSIFPRTVIEGNVFEWSTLLAMAIYAIVAYAIIQLILILTRSSTNIETVETVETVEEL